MLSNCIHEQCPFSHLYNMTKYIQSPNSLNYSGQTEFNILMSSCMQLLIVLGKTDSILKKRNNTTVKKKQYLHVQSILKQQILEIGTCHGVKITYKI